MKWTSLVIAGLLLLVTIALFVATVLGVAKLSLDMELKDWAVSISTLQTYPLYIFMIGYLIWQIRIYFLDQTKLFFAGNQPDLTSTV